MTSVTRHTAPSRTIETDRLLLRPHRVSDFEAVKALWHDAALDQQTPGQSPSEGEAWLRFQGHLSHWEESGFGSWLVIERRDTSPVGEVGFRDTSGQIYPPLGGAPEASWIVAARARRRGIATEAMQAILCWADAHIDLKKTVAMIPPDNAPSLGLAKKLGYGSAREIDYMGTAQFICERFRFGDAHL